MSRNHMDILLRLSLGTGGVFCFVLTFFFLHAIMSLS